MKLLGWMHRKFRQNSSEPLKDFSIGPPSLDEQQYYLKPNYCSKPFYKAQNSQIRKSFGGLDAERVEVVDLEEDSTEALSDLFHGFLAIGTLGTDPILTEPSTPTFAISVENITEKETEVTENELKLINDELEKVLGAEAKDEGCDDSSRRSSYVSTGRSSHVSTITLSGKPIESTDNSGNCAIVCPLQEYLFGSAIGLPETTVAKKEHRTSLGELFQKTKIEENAGAKCDGREKRMEKEADKSGVHLMKKILKRGMLHTSSRRFTAASTGSIDSASAETKLHKILHMFNRKVHPESSAATQKFNKPTKNVIKNNISYEGGYENGLRMLPSEDITIYPQRGLSKETMQCLKNQSNQPQIILDGSDPNGNKECWIKTDEDYLVLEL